MAAEQLRLAAEATKAAEARALAEQAETDARVAAEQEATAAKVAAEKAAEILVEKKKIEDEKKRKEKRKKKTKDQLPLQQQYKQLVDGVHG